MPASLADRTPEAPQEGYAAAREALARGIDAGSPAWPLNPYLARALAEPNVKARIDLLAGATGWIMGLNAAREEHVGLRVIVEKGGRRCLRHAQTGGVRKVGKTWKIRQEA
jgi:hypothetical protein